MMTTREEATGIERPGRLATLREVRAPIDWASIVLRAPQLARASRGDGRPIMLLPGYGTDRHSMRPLGAYLKYLGYDVYDWGLGRNRGDVDSYMVLVGERARELHDELGGVAITLIGWSLGGVVAREAARLFEAHIREVITLGTPIVGGPKYTVVADRYAKIAHIDLDKFEREVHERNSIGIRQPLTCIYSRTDGVVGWRACVDTYNDQARNIEVNSTHFGIGVNGRVWRIIADTLSSGYGDPR
jgi:pimeloyl-ACP methyl ester carboxylesterase